MMSPKLTAALAAVMRRFDNATLAAFNNGVNGFGRVDSGNMAFQPALNAGLIDERGDPVRHEVKLASAFEVNCRVEAGTFN